VWRFGFLSGMARPLRIQFPGAVYHVISRGNERKPIALCSDNYFSRAATIRIPGLPG
jgi:hypothetical protein